ncbi:arylamine N-acetyltransferase [Sphingosinicellaceae bacterium A1X5R2]|nr:arylamine N-acetyltransferase [Pedomonas mirosovicensis]MCH8685323.1 arylamine N-acetyltransferase [Pedomonas mirosovicensis]
MKEGLGAYLDRIGFNGPARSDEDGLAALHEAHGLAIPFENLDILLGKGVSLRPEDVFAKRW